jgi:hypothetical protein
MIAGQKSHSPGRSKAEQEFVMGKSKRYDPRDDHDFMPDVVNQALHGEIQTDSKIDNVIADSASGVHATADAVLTPDAFNQTITQGANIQFNSNTMSVAGHDLQDSHDLG